jgi:large subunit ribosomal protein L31
MKSEIHPKYHENAVITCVCGNVIKTGSTREKMEVEICSKCPPFYTGTEKLIDTAGRVEKFKARKAKSKAAPKKTEKVRVRKTVPIKAVPAKKASATKAVATKPKAKKAPAKKEIAK